MLELLEQHRSELVGFFIFPLVTGLLNVFLMKLSETHPRLSKLLRGVGSDFIYAARGMKKK